jgi:tetratricopeptide (TPR) repeat protein
VRRVRCCCARSIGSRVAAQAAAAAPATTPLLAAIEAALAVNDGATALAHCERAIERDPADCGAHRYRGVLLAMAGRHAEAVLAGKRACELAPDAAHVWSDLGRVYALGGRYEEAALCFREAVEIDARFADGWHNLGTALRQLGQHDQAFAALKQALLLDPTRADTYLNLGGLLAAAGQLDDALECFERAAQHEPKLARARTRLAEHLAGRGKLKRAAELFRESLVLDERNSIAWLGLGGALEDTGDAAGALSCYRNVLAREPAHPAALSQYLALLRTEAPPQLLRATEATLRDERLPDEPRAVIAYGLAKYHDRRGGHAAAAAAGLAANAARRRASGALDRAALRARVDGLIATYDAEFFASRRSHGVGTDQPVFIVGLPRSGTTLTEQIIAAHPRLHGAGELPDLARLAAEAAESGEMWRAAAASDETSSKALAQRYLRALRDGAAKGRLRISDKSPLNFFQLAFAATLFPAARVIHCVRDARDTALSIWFENFNVEQRYATDLDDLAFFTAQYRRLMQHWQSVLPLPILTVSYERTVEDVEAQARAIVDFLGVPWDARCLDFHSTGRAVQTPSRWQVRQPIYARSVQRWRPYAEHLPSLVTAFRTMDDQPC